MRHLGVMIGMTLFGTGIFAPRRRGSAVVDVTANAHFARARAKRLCAGRWHPDLVRHLRSRLAGHLLHGGLANADYWGYQVRAVAPHYRVIVMDSRCLGRSTCDAAPISCRLMDDDVLGMMDFLDVRSAAVIGWSDGAIVRLEIALRHPERASKLFAFAADSSPAGTKDVTHSPVFTAYIARAEREYARLSPTPGRFRAVLERMTNLWAHQPDFSATQLGRIRVPSWIVDGDHDDAINAPTRCSWPTTTQAADC